MNQTDSLPVKHAFLPRFNEQRPHQALGVKIPVDLYTRPEWTRQVCRPQEVAHSGVSKGICTSGRPSHVCQRPSP